jgi:hypothetical protein
MGELAHLLGEKLHDAIDEIEAYAVMNHHWLRVVEGDRDLDRQKLNVCVGDDGTIKKFVFFID